MKLPEFMLKLERSPESIEFDEVMNLILKHYSYVPTSFDNGDISNGVGENEGSCKIFAFGAINQLTELQTLACFGKYYRDEVLGQPESSNHGNIRAFIKHGWGSIKFADNALALNDIE